MKRPRPNHQVSEADEYLKGMKKMVSFQVDEAWLTLEEAKSNMDLAQEALKTAEEGRRLVKVRYEGSLSPIVDLLDAQVSYDHTRSQSGRQGKRIQTGYCQSLFCKRHDYPGFAAGRAEGEIEMNTEIIRYGQQDHVRQRALTVFFLLLATAFFLIGCGEKAAPGSAQVKRQTISGVSIATLDARLDG